MCVNICVNIYMCVCSLKPIHCFYYCICTIYIYIFVIHISYCIYYTIHIYIYVYYLEGPIFQLTIPWLRPWSCRRDVPSWSHSCTDRRPDVSRVVLNRAADALSEGIALRQRNRPKKIDSPWFTMIYHCLILFTTILVGLKDNVRLAVDCCSGAKQDSPDGLQKNHGPNLQVNGVR